MCLDFVQKRFKIIAHSNNKSAKHDNMISTLLIIGGIMTGLAVSHVILKGKNIFDFGKREKTAKEIIEKSKKEAWAIIDKTKKYVEKRRESFQQEETQRENRLKKTAESLVVKEEFLKKREERNKEINLTIAAGNEETQTMQGVIKKTEKETMQKLIDKTGVTPDGLKDKILDRYTAELEQQNTVKLARMEEKIKEDAGKTARDIVTAAIHRLTSPTSVESRAVTVTVPSDHIKGKILGENNENIQELERLLMVDIVFNDLPNTISVSAFMLVERRVAQRAIEKLVRIKTGIGPATVRSAVEAARRETDAELYEIGSKALKIMGINNSNKDFARIVGRLQYRTSYGQNIMKHSMEIGWIAVMLGSELGLNLQTCKVGGFLHDLGKAIDQDPNNDKPHDVLSKELMEKYGFSWEEVHAAWTHHDAIPQETAEALIVKAADAISAGRPGARQESMDKYIERIRALQETAESYQGVRKAYAISAGRELRVEVEPEEVSDSNIKPLAKTIAARIEKEITYPGQIKVNVIRRTKHTEFAR